MDFIAGIAEKYGLFVALVVYILWANREREGKYIERENKYIEVIKTLSEEVKERLAKIETIIKKK